MRQSTCNLSGIQMQCRWAGRQSWCQVNPRNRCPVTWSTLAIPAAVYRSTGFPSQKAADGRGQLAAIDDRDLRTEHTANSAPWQHRQHGCCLLDHNSTAASHRLASAVSVIQKSASLPWLSFYHAAVRYSYTSIFGWPAEWLSRFVSTALRHFVLSINDVSNKMTRYTLAADILKFNSINNNRGCTSPFSYRPARVLDAAV